MANTTTDRPWWHTSPTVKRMIQRINREAEKTVRGFNDTFGPSRSRRAPRPAAPITDPFGLRGRT